MSDSDKTDDSKPKYTEKDVQDYLKKREIEKRKLKEKRLVQISF